MTTAGREATAAAPRLALHPTVTSVSGMFPCYNDEATIADLVARLHTTLAGFGIPFEIVVVDDGSTDQSSEVLDRLKTDVEELRVVRHPLNRGYGAALRSGFAAARFDWIFYTDGDGQYDPAEVTDLLRLAGDDVDWVQGWKLARGDHWSRRVVGRAYHRLVRLLFGVKTRDTDCDFRLIRSRLLDAVELRSSTGAICAELVYKCEQAGGRMVETPVHHFPRRHGSSQFFRIGRVTRTLADVVRLWVRLVVLRRPGG